MIKEKNIRKSEECKNLKEFELDTETLENISGGEGEEKLVPGLTPGVCFSCTYGTTRPDFMADFRHK